MGRIYEALQRTTTNRHDTIHSAVTSDSASAIRPVTADAGINMLHPREYESIKTNFLARYAHLPIKTVMFSGLSPNCGASTTAANFAACLAKDTQLKVLLMDVNLRSPALHRFFPMGSDTGLLDFLQMKQSSGLAIKKAGADELYLLTSGGKCDHPAQLLESKRYHRLLEKVHAAMDYVILDGPLSSVYPESMAMCRKVDGIVLVAEAGKSRRQAALRIKKEFEAAGGYILGTVLCKRKYHIPDCLYKRL